MSRQVVARITQQTLDTIAVMRSNDVPLPVIAQYVHAMQAYLELVLLNMHEDATPCGTTSTQSNDKAM